MHDGGDDALVDDKLLACESAIGYQFQDRTLLRRCLTHASVARTRLESNERLEFLGDAVLGLIVCRSLFERYPEYPEGELTRIKSALVSRSTCARISLDLGLAQFMFVGKGLSRRAQIPTSILAAVLEALIAGIYLDGGLKAADTFVRQLLGDEIEAAGELHSTRNYKSVLQQLAQKSYGDTPIYQLLDEKGPDHSKCFKIAAVIGHRSYPSAWGPSKKEAEQRAAHNALCEIQGQELPHVTD